MTANSSHGSSLNRKMQMIDLTGRVNFLDKKNNKIEKSMIACINFLRKPKLSEEKSIKSSTNKTTASSKSHQQFRMTKRNYLKRQDIEKEQQVNQDLLQNKQVISSQRNQQRDYKVEKTLRGFAQRSVRTQPYPDNDSPTNPLVIQQTNPLSKCQNEQKTSQPKGKTFIRRLNTNTNYLQENKQNSSTLQKISLKQKQQRQKKKRQQQLKLVDLKRKLLQEEQKSIKEFENCVLYKQKLVDKLKSEERLKQLLSGNTMFKVKHQN